MQYLYKDGTDYYFMDTSNYEQIHMSEEALGDSVNYLLPESTIRVEFYEATPVGIELPATVDLEGRGHRARHQGRDRERAGQAGALRDRAGRYRARRSSTPATSSASTRRLASIRAAPDHT